MPPLRQRIYFRSLRVRLRSGIRMNVARVSRADSRRSLKSASIAMRVAVSSRLVLPGTLPRIALTRERNQVRITSAPWRAKIVSRFSYCINR
jgi:hypothetical protein